MATIIDTLVTIIDFKTNTAGIKKADKGLKTLEIETKALNVAVLNLSHAFSGLIGLFGLEKLIELNNEFDLVTNRLKSVGLEGSKLNEVFDKLLAISNKTGTSIEANSELYQQMAVSLGDAATEADKLTVVDSLNKLFAINGTNTRTAKAAMQDLTKSISGATVNYQELRFAMKDVPALQALIVNHFRNMGVDWKEAIEGNKLATSEFIKILKDSNNDLTKQFGLMSRTIPMAFMAIRNSLSFFVGEIGRASTGVAVFTTIMDKVAALFTEWAEAVKSKTKEAKAALEAFGIFLTGLAAFVAIRLTKMLLPFVRMAAGIMLVVLAIQDLWVFMRGGNSVFGQFLNWLGLTSDQIDQVRQSIVGFVDGLKSVVKWVLTSRATLIDLAGILTTMGALWAVEKVLAFAKGIRTIASAIALAELAASPLLLIIDAIIIAIVALITVAITYREEITNAFNVAATMIEATWQVLADFFMMVWDSVIKFFVDGWNEAVSNFTGTISIIKSLWGSVTSFFTSTWDSVVSGLTSVWDGFIDKVTAGFKFVKDSVNKVLSFVGLGSDDESEGTSQFKGNVVDFGQEKSKRQKDIQSLIVNAQAANNQITGGLAGNVVSPQSFGGVNQNNQNTVNVTVNASTNASPDEIAKMTSQHVQDSLSQQFRSAAVNADNTIAR